MQTAVRRLTTRSLWFFWFLFCTGCCQRGIKNQCLCLPLAHDSPRSRGRRGGFGHARRCRLGLIPKCAHGSAPWGCHPCVVTALMGTRVQMGHPLPKTSPWLRARQSCPGNGWWWNKSGTLRCHFYSRALGYEHILNCNVWEEKKSLKA